MVGGAFEKTLTSQIARDVRRAAQRYAKSVSIRATAQKDGE